MNIIIYDYNFSSLGSAIVLFLIFVLGAISAWYLPKYKGFNIGEVKMIIIRFLKHMIAMIPVILVLVITYYIAEALFKYGNSILPELIGAGVSVIVIDFLFKERELKKRKNIDKLLDSKLSKINKLINAILLKFIDLQSLENEQISRDLLNDLLNREDLNTSNVRYERITSEGKYEVLEVSKFDFLYYAGVELRPIVESFISKYASYLDENLICYFIEIEEVLNKKIFKTKLSTLGNITGENYISYRNAVLESLIKLKDASQKMRRN